MEPMGREGVGVGMKKMGYGGGQRTSFYERKREKEKEI